jgi:predicted nucleic acid-binding protein
VIIVDTNLISEFTRMRPSGAVMQWLRFQDARELFVTSVSEAEMFLGAMLLPRSKRRDDIIEEVQAIFDRNFRDRILPFNSPAARAYAAITAERRRLGRPISTADAQIAAIARSRGATLATRNVRDFEYCGIAIVDPWNF